MVLTGNTGDSPTPNSLCAKGHNSDSYVCGSYPNVQTCRDDSYAHPTNSNTDTTHTDSCATDSNTNTAYADPYPSDSDADTAHANPCTTHSNARTAHTDATSSGDE